MDREEVLSTLGEALTRVTHSLVFMTGLAGSLHGLAGVAVKFQLRTFVQAEVEDLYRLTEKFSALGGRPVLSSTRIELPSDPREGLRQLIDAEATTLAALHAVIPHSGQEPESEALEHLLEHVIMRKQQQIDFIRHATD